MNLRKKWFRFEFVLNVLGLVMVAMMSFGLPGHARAATVALHGTTEVINVLITPLRATVESRRIIRWKSSVMPPARGW